ncbi:hypothetical protein ACROYT_G032170 [Oculina patagonica]
MHNCNPYNRVKGNRVEEQFVSIHFHVNVYVHFQKLYHFIHCNTGSCVQSVCEEHTFGEISLNHVADWCARGYCVDNHSIPGYGESPKKD